MFCEPIYMATVKRQWNTDIQISVNSVTYKTLGTGPDPSFFNYKTEFNQTLLCSWGQSTKNGGVTSYYLPDQNEGLK